MAQDVEFEKLGQETGWVGSCLLWFFWGVSLSFMTILSLVLLVLLAASVTLNLYLGWEMSGLEVAVSRPSTGAVEGPVPIPTGVLAAIPTNTPTPTPSPTLAPTESPLEAQYGTLAAIATEVAASPPGGTPLPPSLPPADTPTVPPTDVPPASAIGTPAGETAAIESEPDDTQPAVDTQPADEPEARRHTASVRRHPGGRVGGSRRICAAGHIIKLIFTHPYPGITRIQTGGGTRRSQPEAEGTAAQPS